MQFWDGRAKDVEEQAGMPILNPVEMAIPNEKFLLDRLAAIEMYRKLFKSAFPDEANPITYKNIEKAIAVFERDLITPSRFDQYKDGDKSALSLEEKKGLLTFINIGCTNCHNGVALGGTTIQQFGAYDDYWKYTGSKAIDKGKGALTKDKLDDYYFKTPSLRNIAETSPYFHDGSVKTLEEAVDIMAKIQLRYNLSESEKSNLVAFLGSLNGNVPLMYQQAPEELSAK
jgi:cytochrome c peroxidase